MRRATSDTAFKMVCRDRRMDRGARSGVNQGEAEGVDCRPRLKLNPPICARDCPRGAAVGCSYGIAVQKIIKNISPDLTFGQNGAIL